MCDAARGAAVPTSSGLLVLSFLYEWFESVRVFHQPALSPNPVSNIIEHLEYCEGALPRVVELAGASSWYFWRVEPYSISEYVWNSCYPTVIQM